MNFIKQYGINQYTIEANKLRPMTIFLDLSMLPSTYTIEATQHSATSRQLPNGRVMVQGSYADLQALAYLWGCIEDFDYYIR